METTARHICGRIEAIKADRDSAHQIRETAETRGDGWVCDDGCCHTDGCCNSCDVRVEVRKTNGDHTQGIPTEDHP